MSLAAQALIPNAQRSASELPPVRNELTSGYQKRAPEPRVTLSPVVEPEVLVLRCQAGDRDAFRELFRRHRSDVARLVQRLLGGRGDIDDVVQEVFLQVHRSLKDFRFGSRFSTWLYRVTVNVVLMQRRAARSRPQLVEAPEGLTPLDGAATPEEQVVRSRRIAAFYRLLERLSEKKRTAYILHEMEGMSPAEIAEAVKAPVLTVRTRLFYARRELVALLREEPSLSSLLHELGDLDLATDGEPHKEPA